MKFKAIVLATVFGFLLWMGLTWQFDAVNLVVGGSVALILGLSFGTVSHWNELRLTPRAMVALMVWLVVLMVELVKSNVDVMLRVIAPKVRINPAIVEVKTRLNTHAGRLALANSITLTPGTLTADVIEDKLYVHWIDAKSTEVEGATKEIVKKFEKHLEVIFG